MTIHYTATLNNKHLSLTALYPDGNREVIAILPVTELGALINRNNTLMQNVPDITSAECSQRLMPAWMPNMPEKENIPPGKMASGGH